MLCFYLLLSVIVGPVGPTQPTSFSTQPNPTHEIRTVSQHNPTQPNPRVNPTHGQLWFSWIRVGLVFNFRTGVVIWLLTSKVSGVLDEIPVEVLRGRERLATERWRKVKVILFEGCLLPSQTWGVTYSRDRDNVWHPWRQVPLWSEPSSSMNSYSYTKYKLFFSVEITTMLRAVIHV